MANDEVSQAAQEASAPFKEIVSNAGVAAARSAAANTIFKPAVEAGTGATADQSLFMNLLSGNSSLGALGSALAGVGTVFAGSQIAPVLSRAILGKTDVDALQSAARQQFESLPKTLIEGPGFDIVAGTGGTTFVKVNDPAAFNDFINLIQRGPDGPTPIPVAEGDRAVLSIGDGIFRVTLPPTEIAKNFENFATIENNLRAGQSLLQQAPLDAKRSLFEQALANQGLSDALTMPNAITPSGTPLSDNLLTAQPVPNQQMQALQDTIRLRNINPLAYDPRSIAAQLGGQLHSPARTVTATPAGNAARGPVEDTITVTAGSPHVSGRPQATIPASTVGQAPPPTGTTPVPPGGHRNIYI